MADLSLPHSTAPGSNRRGDYLQETLEGIRDFVNGSGWVDDDRLASPNNGVYRSLTRASGFLQNDSVAGTYFFTIGDSGGTFAASGSGSGVHLAGGIYLDDADYTVAGKATRLRVRASVSANATQPTLTFTFGLYPVSFAGGVDTLTATLGAVVASSTAAIASPPASSTTSAVSADVSVPSDGLYALGVVTSGTLTNNSAVWLAAQLQMRHV